MKPEKTTDILMKIAICVDINSAAIVNSVKMLQESECKDKSHFKVRNRFQDIRNRLNLVRN